MPTWSKTGKNRLELYRRYLEKEKIYCPGNNRQINEEGYFTEVGGYVLGPILNAYVVWVLQEAIKSGKKRLYFLARDGYFMYQAAQIYVKRLHLDLDCRYVSCSRYSLRIPMFHLNEEEALEYICRDSIGVNLERILNRAGLNQKEQREVLEELGMSGKEKESIPYVRLETVKENLSHSAGFMGAMRRHSVEALPGLRGYLAQKGFLDGVEDAIVDSGWVGSMQKTLNQVLESMGREKAVEGYYWGLYELPPDVVRENYHCYYFSPEGQLPEKVNFNNNLFETIFSAPHGMTLGYEKTEDGYIPVYSPLTPERKDKMEQLEAVLMEYTAQAAGQVKDIRETDCERERRAMKKLLKMFMGNPTKDEAEICGKLVFCDDVLEYESRPLAVKMDERELCDNHLVSKILVMLGLRKREIRESAWYEGSVVRSAKRPRYHLMQYGMYKYLVYIRQMYMWRKNNVQKREG